MNTKTWTCMYMTIAPVRLVQEFQLIQEFWNQTTFQHLPKSNVSGVTVMGVVGDSIAIRPSVSRLFTVLRKESQNLLPANKTLLSPYSVSFNMHIDFFYVIIYKSTIFFEVTATWVFLSQKQRLKITCASYNFIWKTGFQPIFGL